MPIHFAATGDVIYYAHMPKTMHMVLKLNSLLQRGASVAEEFLGLQEACAKLWQAVATKKSKREQERRLASLIIATRLIADKLEIEYSDDIVERRLREIVRNKNTYKLDRA